MNHILVLPMHDPKGIMFPHLERITPALKETFSAAVISIIPGDTREPLSDPFYHALPVPNNLPVGSHFLTLYRHAAGACPPDAVLHLCFTDRLAFQVETDYREDFFASIRALSDDSLPMLFQRSPAAWATHPANYHEIESAVTTIGRWVFGRSLDFAWCHLALPARRLAEILPAVRRADMSMMAEIIVQLSGDIHTQDVDWLAWEDPFLFNRPAAEYNRERAASLEETRKRLSYALPMLDVLYQAANKSTGQ